MGEMVTEGSARLKRWLDRLFGAEKHNLMTIVQPPHDGQGAMLANGTRFVLRDGTEITHVARATVTFAADEFVVATLDIAIHPSMNIEAHPLLGIETLRAAAEYYGFELVKSPKAALVDLAEG